jgi:acetyltransferase-like isoleucine patch superfamily enzyme
MSSFGRMFKAITGIIRHRLELMKYDEFCIEDYFRGQGVRIGRDNRIYVTSLGAEPYLVNVGNHCTIAAGVSFITHDGAAWLFTQEYPSVQRFGVIDIKDNCFIGLRSIILPNVNVGPNSIVAAGAVVTKDVPPGTIVGGNPARILGATEEYRGRVLTAWEAQRPPGYLEELQDGEEYTPKHIDRCKVRAQGKLMEHLLRHLRS